MMTKLCAFLTALAACLSLACNDKVEPPPQFNAVLTDGADGSGTKLLPVRLAKRDKAALIAPAASSETPPAPTGGSAAATPKTAEVTIDDSTAEAAAQSFASLLKAGDLARLPDIVVPEQQEPIQQIVKLVQPVLEAQSEVQKAIAAKFPGHAFKMGGMPGGMPSDVQITNIEAAGDEEATATLETQGSPAQPIKLRKIDGKWKVEAAQFGKAPTEAELQQVTEAMTKMADALKSVAAKINDGTIADVQAVPKGMAEATGMPEALFSVEQTTEEKAPGEEGNATPTPDATEENAKSDESGAAAEPTGASEEKPADTEEKPADTTAKPKERERDAVDDVISGPTINRNRD